MMTHDSTRSPGWRRRCVRSSSSAGGWGPCESEREQARSATVWTQPADGETELVCCTDLNWLSTTHTTSGQSIG